MLAERVLIVIPTRGQFDYAARAIASGVYYTPDPTALVIDDASPEWSDAWIKAMVGACPPGRLAWIKLSRSAFGPNLTRSWNRGLVFARESGFRHVVLANSDVIFASGWWAGIRAGLRRYDFIGPVTNAPGHQQEQLSDVADRLVEPDDQYALNLACEPLIDIAEHEFSEAPYLNGFCFAGQTERFWSNSFDNLHVFDPSKPMVGNEDEFFERARDRGMKMGIARGSFVFHYRSVSRGIEHANIGAYRRSRA